MKSIGILLFDGVELLDFAGPLEVFTAANYLRDSDLFKVETVGLTDRISVSKSKLNIKPDRHIDDVSAYDLFLLPGGFGTRPIINDEISLAKIYKVVEQSERVASVCTGSLILAKLGCLKQKKATSHHLALGLLQKIDASIDIQDKHRYIDEEQVITSAGVSAGIDMSFYLLEKAFGRELSEQTARYMEYITCN